MNILVTGGASGLGEAITKRLAREPDYFVHFTYCTADRNAVEIQKNYPNTALLKCDFTKDSDVQSLQEYIGHADIDILINNAFTGSFIDMYFHKTTLASYETAFAANILPTIAITQAAINCFRKKKAGKIITILSAALTDKAPIGSSVYVATKAYLAELAKIWAIENVKFNISSNTISPSFMQTSFTKDMDERLIEQLREQNSSKKILTTDEVAESVLFLVNTNQQINGVDFVINSETDVV
jgi:3-oxoacyl-[acyl-carrier protein] reductase